MADDKETDSASQGTGAREDGIDEVELTEEQRIELRHRRELAKGVDDADASHQGGAGAQGGAVDFGNPKNFGLPN